jgi:ligand-binding sensor domain-containing protein
VWRHNPRDANSISDDQVTTLWREKNGNMWLGGPAGVNHLNVATGAIRSLSFVRGDPASDTIRNIVGDRSGVLWIASRGGLHRLDPNTLESRTFRHDPADPAACPTTWCGRSWKTAAASCGSAPSTASICWTARPASSATSAATNPNSLSHDEVHCLYEDARGTIWVGTAAGLNKMEVAADGSVKFRRYLRKDGIADDAIASILPDDAGNLWLSTNSGLSRLNIETGLVRNYSGADGTIEGAYFDGAALRTPDGTLYFGGFNGITALRRRRCARTAWRRPWRLPTSRSLTSRSSRGRASMAMC